MPTTACNRDVPEYFHSTVPDEAHNPKSSKPSDTGMTVNLSPRASAVLRDLAAVGVKQKLIMERILEWFATLERKHQMAIILMDEGLQQELARDTLIHMAALEGTDLSKATIGMDAEKARDAIHLVADQLYKIALSYRHQTIDKPAKKPRPS